MPTLGGYAKAHPVTRGKPCSVCALPPKVAKEINGAYLKRTHSVRQIFGYLTEPVPEGLGLSVSMAALAHHFYQNRHHERAN
jgi:hypothetical protein